MASARMRHVPLGEILPGRRSLLARLHQAAKRDDDVIVHQRSVQHDMRASGRALCILSRCQFSLRMLEPTERWYRERYSVDA